ncbi:transferase [Lithospermum erythrorhizon]|uniref:Glutathione S-transferase n=1 Tax=Lithospermum erythrorhizon TaxID=34254 RepID=A0AAV3NN72_LITER
MASSDVKLLGAWPSPFVIRARIALNIKAIKYEFLEEQMGAKSELLLKSNPVHKKIPVLIHDDKPICESLVIVQYIDEAWSSGPQILPSDPHDRAIARFWAAYIDDKWFPSVRAIGSAPNDEERNAAIGQLQEGLALLEDAFKKISNGKKFFGGDNIGYLDIALGCNLGWVRVIENMNNVKLFDEEKTPCLFKWAQEFCDDPAAKDVIPETGKLMEFAKIVIARMKAAAQN